MRSLDDFAAQKLASLAQAGLRRGLAETVREDGLWIRRNGRRLLSFSCNDYLNLTHHPRVKAAATAAIEAHGAGSGASRLVTGNHAIFHELERKLARIKGTEDACVFGSGYLANAGILPVLIGEGGLILIDELSHSCLWSGARLSKGTTITFRHNDCEHVAELLRTHRADYARALIVTDGVFSMDGDLAPLRELAELGRRHDAWLMSDDAHGLGVLGGGAGSAAGLDVPLQMGTLSKAIGGYGGYLAGSKPVIELMRNRARTFVYSTGLPPAMAAAASAALDVIADDSELTARPLANARRFTKMTNLPQAQSPIVPVVVGEAEAALAASRLLEEDGFYVAPIRPPTVPPGTARLRIAFTAGHPERDIERLAAVVRSHILAA